MDWALLFQLLYVVVPFGKYQGQALGDVPSRYLDSEVVKWDRTLFVRQCELAMDLAWRATQEAKAWRALQDHELIPSKSTLFQICWPISLELDDRQEGMALGHVEQPPVHPHDRQSLFMALVMNGMEERELRRQFYGLLPDLSVGAQQKAYYRARKQAEHARQIEVAQGIVIDLRVPVA